ncbi:MAG: hypothetical protein GX663_06960 [Clostridiales bacterium]|nr:hypothetical protein [Clostridiales bacterium]
MGLWQDRRDEISGAESVELYNRYEKTGDENLEKKILLHNNDDVKQLTRLTPVIMKSDFHKAMFHMGFPARNLMVENISLRKDGLIVRGRQLKDPFDYMGFSLGDCPAQSRFTSKTRDFHFKMPLIWDSGYAIADIQALGLDKENFTRYPTCSSGFLVLESTGHEPQKNYMEINHLVKSFIDLFMNTI